MNQKKNSVPPVVIQNYLFEEKLVASTNDEWKKKYNRRHKLLEKPFGTIFIIKLGFITKKQYIYLFNIVHC